MCKRYKDGKYRREILIKVKYAKLKTKKLLGLQFHSTQKADKPFGQDLGVKAKFDNTKC